MKILLTGSAGFIAGYLIDELLRHGHDVVGIDNYSKYGELRRSYDDHPRYRCVRGDAKDVALLRELAGDCDQLVAAAAMVGGITYFHEYAYDLLAENSRLVASAFDAALWAFAQRRLKRVVVVSSSMVYEGAVTFPCAEGDELRIPAPRSTYGMQKLCTEYFALGAREQHGLPYTILRPFNCVGIGEQRAVGGREVRSGNIQLALSHVLPDLVQKALRGQDPLHVFGDGAQLRHYTYGGDLARGIRLAIESERAVNQDFNLASATGTTVRELAEAVWRRVHPAKPLRLAHDPPLQHDVRQRIPSVQKARELLGFEATTGLEQVLDEVVPWVREQIALGTL